MIKRFRSKNHGQSRNKSSTYRSWLMMKNRCQNPRSNDYKYYGGKGIKVCDRWKRWELFHLDMGDKPTPLHTLGRINSEKDYCLTNCRWETRKEQSRSRKYCKLNKEKAEIIKKLFNKGFSQVELAELFEVGPTAISYTLRGKSWA